MKEITQRVKYLQYQEVDTYTVVLPNFSSAVEKSCQCDFGEMSCLGHPVVQMYLFCGVIFYFFAGTKFS